MSVRSSPSWNCTREKSATTRARIRPSRPILSAHALFTAMYALLPIMHETRKSRSRASNHTTQSTHDMLRARRLVGRSKPRHRSTAGQDCPSLPRRGVPARTKRFVTFQTCTGAKIATVFRYDESREATHYHILPAAENSMLPALTAPIWSQQNGGYLIPPSLVQC